MHGEPIPNGSDRPPSREEKEEELQYLLHHGLVRDGTQLHALLEYLGSKALTSSEPLKEYTIGVEALGKPANHDPRIDPTVRVEIAKLRKRLKEYYREAGATRTVHLEIPHGSYLPVFLRAPIARRPGPATPAWRRGRMAAIAAFVVVTVLSLVVWKRMSGAGTEALTAFWAPHLEGSTPTLLVCGTPMFMKIKGGYYRDTNTNRPEEMAASKRVQRVVEALKPEPDELRPVFTFVGMGEAHGIFDLTKYMAAHGVQLILRQSHEVEWGDFKNRHVIFLGGKKYNAQIPMLPYKPAFEAERRKIRNLRPLKGERAEYLTASATQYGEITEEYALISVYPGLTAGTRLMTLDCSSTEGTLAAAEFLTREDLVSQLVGRGVPLRASGGKYPAFQAVIRAKFNKSVPVELSYVTHRVMLTTGTPDS